MGILICTVVPLVFAWLLPLALCRMLWWKEAPVRVRKRFLLALYPLVLIGLFLGDALVRKLRPEDFAWRGDNPTQAAELTLAWFLSFSYVAFVKLLACSLRPGPRIPRSVAIVGIIESITWFPALCVCAVSVVLAPASLLFHRHDGQALHVFWSLIRNAPVIVVPLSFRMLGTWLSRRHARMNPDPASALKKEAA